MSVPKVTTEVMISSVQRFALMHELRGEAEPDLNQQLMHLSPCDLLLVEGFKREKLPKIEVYRAEVGEARIYPGDPDVVAIAGDTIPCAGLDELCAGADVYVQTVIRADIVKNIPVQRFTDIMDYHSSVEDAARTAARAGVATLVLTHYVPSMQPGQEDEWRTIAASHFSGLLSQEDWQSHRRVARTTCLSGWRSHKKF